jgi:hypothetical protein
MPDYTNYTEGQMQQFQDKWKRENPNATVAGNSPLLIRKRQLEEKRRAATVEKGRRYNENMVRKNKIDFSPEKQAERRKQMGW